MRRDNWVAEGDLRAVAVGAEPPSIESYEVRLIRDLATPQLRWTGGDIRGISRGYLSSRKLLGSSVERDPEIGFQRARSTRYVRAFEVQNPSRAEVLVNGRVVRTMNLPPGSYEFLDFPLLPGSNTVVIRLIDSYGQERVLSGSAAYASDLLEAGATSFGAAAGVYRSA